MATGRFYPDPVPVPGLPQEEGFRRARPGRFEEEDFGFHRRVRESYRLTGACGRRHPGSGDPVEALLRLLRRRTSQNRQRLTGFVAGLKRAVCAIEKRASPGSG